MRPPAPGSRTAHPTLRDCLALRSPRRVRHEFPQPLAQRSRRKSPRRGRLRIAVADPGGDHPAHARRVRRRRPGADRHRQDRRVRVADPFAHRPARSTRRRRWCWCRRASWRSRLPKHFSATRRTCTAFTSLPIYGGQSYTPQLHSLRRGVHVVVGTPGRVMDHLKRGTLKLDTLKHIVLDEADEMLRMGFIDDVEWILEQAPKKRQIALFSATMPAADPPHRADPPAQARRSHDQEQDQHRQPTPASATGSSAACTSSTR